MRPRHLPPFGVTLLEMSVVLIVIGLLMGGILVGRELISAAELRSVAAQVGRYDAAVMMFKAKYGGLPGDLSDAVEQGLADAGCAPYDSPTCDIVGAPAEGGCNGNYNGTLDGNFAGGGGGAFRHCPEMLGFWYHLSHTGLIEGLYDGKTVHLTSPASWSSPIYGISAPRTRLREVGIAVAGSYYIVGLTDSWIAGAKPGELFAKEAAGLDEKMDDGRTDDGRVRLFVGACAKASDPSVYDLSKTTERCAVLVKIAGFEGP